MASPTSSSSLFGCSVAISGQYIVVGATEEDPSGVSDAGSAYVFKINDTGTSVEQIAKINADDYEADDLFGWSVAISGQYIVVGANNEDPSGADTAGSAYVFKYS